MYIYILYFIFGTGGFMVRLHEYQGKRLLKTVGIPVPEGEVAFTPHEARKIAEKIGKPVAIKAQVLTTGRFKAGGIKFAESPQEAESVASEILNKEIKGLKVEKLLVEERLDIEKEFFLSITINDSYKVKGPVIMFSTEGGVDVEEVAEKSPEKISSMNIDYLRGFQLPDAQKLISQLNVPQSIINPIGNIACKLYEVFVKADASTAEINPLILTKDGRIIAGDCRITIDDNSVFRHPEFEIDLPRDMTRPPTELEKIAWKIEEKDYRGVCYFIQLNPNIDEVRKGGYIAFHGIGGGASMLAADALIQRGLKLATYVDTSGNPTASKVYRAIKVLLSIPGIEGYGLFGAVMANQEQWYHGYAIVKALREESRNRPGFPVLILIAGNKERETHRIIREGLKDTSLRWELYGRDHIYDIDFLAERMVDLIEKSRKEGAPHVKASEIAVYPETRVQPEECLSFEFETGRLIIDLNKCIAPKCGFVCVKACRWFGRSCLKIKDGKPALVGSPEQLKRLCNECLACEVECELHGGKAIKIELPLYDLEEFRKRYGVPI
jgi:succinyl-CoA synthetase beta subunit